MENKTQERLILIDGHGLAYQMYFALRPEAFSTAQGETTNAIYGFARRLLQVINSPTPPDYLAVSFDVGETFRDALYAEYKGTREPMPDDLHAQIERMHDMLRAFNIPIFEVPGFEADDVLGTISYRVGEMGLESLILTGDKDLLQLVSPYTKVEMASRNNEPGKVYDESAVMERFGVTPDQFVDYKAFIGDKSDNIPGVKGIGDKGAAKLLQQFGTLDAIYQRLDEVEPAGLRQKLADGRESAFLGQKLCRIVRDVPLEFDLEACRTHDFNRDEVVAIFRELEFRSLIDQLPGGQKVAVPSRTGQLSMFDAPSDSDESATPVDLPTRTIVVQDEETLNALVQRLESATVIAFDTETTNEEAMLGKLVGMSFAVEPEEAYYIPVGHIDTDELQLSLEHVMQRLRPALTDPTIAKVAHNIKYDAIVMEQHGLKVSPLSFDTMIGQSLVRHAGSSGKLGLKAQAFIRLGIEMTEITALIGTGKKQITMDRVAIRDCAPYAAADADMTLRIYQQIQQEVTEQGVDSLFRDIEMPLVPVLCAMEQAGVFIDPAPLRSLSKELTETLAELQQNIWDICGFQFNMNSTQQLSKALFENLNLSTQGIRKTQSGHYSTAVDVLEALQDQDKTGVIQLIMQYRELEKLRSTYLDALPALIHPVTGRVHTSFNQAGAVTGRLSSSNPNLQNIPIRSDLGRRVRDAFIAAPGHRLIAADYSQVELRILADVSGDEGMKQAFLEDQDIHATTAATVYGIPLEEVTRNQRSFAKAVNFGLMYGMGAFRLARDANMPLDDAKAFIKTYFERFPGVRAYLDQTLATAKENGYVETPLGRRRYFPIFKEQKPNNQEVARAEREAINMPIQGAAADIIKIAMVHLYQALEDRDLNGRIILQVHDELVLEVPDAEIEVTAILVREMMENAYAMNVPLRVDVNIGERWGEMK